MQKLYKWRVYLGKDMRRPTAVLDRRADVEAMLPKDRTTMVKRYTGRHCLETYVVEWSNQIGNFAWKPLRQQ